MESPDSTVDPTPDTAAQVPAPDVIDLTPDAAETAETADAADAAETVIDLTSSEDAPAGAPEADTSTSAPSVDALEEQLDSLQGAMDKLQAGDLDGAERTIEALEQKIASLRN